MPKHVRSIECCYCGAASLVNLQDANRDSLTCGACGAGMAIKRMQSVSSPPDAAGWNGEAPPRLAPQWRGDTGQRGPLGPKPDREKRKKSSGFFDMIEDLWDEVEDIFD
jgi:hypothetical protein